MATCYLCGCKGADFRRNVKTGHLQGHYSSVRFNSKSTSTSYGNSTRNYYGLRTVCEDCAFDIDKEKLQSRIDSLQMRIGFSWVVIAILILLIIFMPIFLHQ